MAEWSIEIDSDPGATWNPDQVEALRRELVTGGALAPACSHNTETGSVGATFQVKGSFFDAMHIGQSIWIASMPRAGMPPSIRHYEQRPNDPAAA
jgi:hypothetical protein